MKRADHARDRHVASRRCKDELQDMINRGVGVVPGAGLGSRRARPGLGPQELASWRHLHTPDGRAAGRPSPASASPTRWTPRWPRCGASRSRHADHAGQEQGGAAKKAGKTGKKVTAEEPGRVHPPVLGHDRRRSAAGPVPRDSRQPGRRQELRGGHPADAHRRRGRRVARRRDAASIPKTFDPLFTNMVAAGEAGGILDTILKRLATYIEKAVKLAGQVKSAMIYPVAVIVIAASSSASFSGRSSRRSRSCSPGLGAELPLPTRVVIALSNNLVRFFSRSIVGRRSRGYACSALLRDDSGPPRGRRGPAEGAGARQHPAEDRRGAVLPDAVDAHQLGRADSRRPGDHREDRRQRDHRGRRDGDAQEHRARRDDRGAAQGDRRCFRRW